MCFTPNDYREGSLEILKVAMDSFLLPYRQHEGRLESQERDSEQERT